MRKIKKAEMSEETQAELDGVLIEMNNFLETLNEQGGRVPRIIELTIKKAAVEEYVRQLEVIREGFEAEYRECKAALEKMTANAKHGIEVYEAQIEELKSKNDEEVQQDDDPQAA